MYAYLTGQLNWTLIVWQGVQVIKTWQTTPCFNNQSAVTHTIIVDNGALNNKIIKAYPKHYSKMCYNLTLQWLVLNVFYSLKFSIFLFVLFVLTMITELRQKMKSKWASEVKNFI